MIPGVWHVRDAILRLQPTPLYALLRFPLSPWILVYHCDFGFVYSSPALSMGFTVTCLELFRHCVVTFAGALVLGEGVCPSRGWGISIPPALLLRFGRMRVRSFFFLLQQRYVPLANGIGRDALGWAG
jgi:hypothetical protein